MQTVDGHTGKQAVSSNRRKLLRKKLYKRIGVQSTKDFSKGRKSSKVQSDTESEEKYHNDENTDFQRPVKRESEKLEVTSDGNLHNIHADVKLSIKGHSEQLQPKRCVDCCKYTCECSKRVKVKVIHHRKENVRRVTVSPVIDHSEQTDNSVKQQHVSDSAVDQSRVFHSRLSFTNNEAVREDGKTNTHGIRKRHRRRSFSDVTPEGDKGYIPSWLDEDVKGMDRRSRLSKSSMTSDQVGVKKSRSISDLREISASKTAQADVLSSFPKDPSTQKSKDHAKIEEEYLKMRKQINMGTDQSHDTSLLNSTLSSVRTSSMESPASKLSLLMEQRNAKPDPDELGINYFQKHIQNVKQTSKKYKRSLKPKRIDNAEKQTRRKLPSRFIPIYEG